MQRHPSQRPVRPRLRRRDHTRGCHSEALSSAVASVPPPSAWPLPQRRCLFRPSRGLIRGERPPRCQSPRLRGLVCSNTSQGRPLSLVNGGDVRHSRAEASSAADKPTTVRAALSAEANSPPAAVLRPRLQWRLLLPSARGFVRTNNPCESSLVHGGDDPAHLYRCVVHKTPLLLPPASRPHPHQHPMRLCPR